MQGGGEDHHTIATPPQFLQRDCRSIALIARPT